MGLAVDHHVAIGMLTESRRHLAYHQRSHLNLPRRMSVVKYVSGLLCVDAKGGFSAGRIVPPTSPQPDPNETVIDCGRSKAVQRRRSAATQTHDKNEMNVSFRML